MGVSRPRETPISLGSTSQPGPGAVLSTHGVEVKQVEVERDGKWFTGTMGLWREDPQKGWVATVRYSTGARAYMETIPADRLRELPDKK